MGDSLDDGVRRSPLCRKSRYKQVWRRESLEGLVSVGALSTQGSMKSEVSQS